MRGSFVKTFHYSMDQKSVSDQILSDLKVIPKIAKNPNAKWVTKGKHTERNYELASIDDSYFFTLFERQSTLDRSNFSCGLIWKASKNQSLILTRYNGRNHPHTNHIEGDEFEYTCHIHVATERYIKAGYKAEHYAKPTDQYYDLDGAMKCLLEDWNIQINKKLPKNNKTVADNNQPNLFK